MAEFTKGEMTLRKYRKLDAIYLDDKCIIKMAFPKITKELVRRWNSHDDLLAACEFAKSQIKKGAQKKALPILEAAIAQAKKS